MAKKRKTKRSAPRRPPAKKTTTKRKRPARKRNSVSATPVVLVNPTGVSAVKKKKRTTKRRAPTRRKNPTTRRRRAARRRNPTVKWGDAGKATLLGGLGGGAAWGVDYGVGMIPIPEYGKAAITGGGGLVVGLGLAKLGAPMLGAGVAGGMVAKAIDRGLAAMALGQAQAEAEKPATDATPAEAGRVYTETGRVYREAGRLVPQQGATTLPAPHLRAPTLKESGASRFVPGPVRLMGPHGWATKPNVRYVSAHNRR